MRVAALISKRKGENGSFLNFFFGRNNNNKDGKDDYDDISIASAFANEMDRP